MQSKPKPKPKSKPSTPFNNRKLSIDAEVKFIKSGEMAKPRKSPFTSKADNARIDSINAKLKKKK